MSGKNVASIHYPSCQVSWLNLVYAEIISVTSAMRKNSRWSGVSISRLNMGGLGMSMGLRGRSAITEDSYQSQESPLMTGFSNLRVQLSNVSDVREIDALALLEPFLEVIRSGDTNGPITATALSSVEKFLTYEIININSPNISIAMSTLSSAATHCKFEPSDSVSDEFVLLKILQILRLALTSDVGQVLSDEALCEMMETGLSMCCQMRLSEMLRRSAEHTMIVMVQFMFQRYDDYEKGKDKDIKTFGLPSIKELLRVLISLLDPHNHKHTDTMRLMALSILNVAFEVGGRTMGHFESLRNLVADELCKFLFQLARTDNILLLLLTLRVISTVFDTLRPYLKLQQELYLSFLIERLCPPTNNFRNLEISLEFNGSLVSIDSPLSSGMSTPLHDRNLRSSGDSSIATGEARELLLESLGQLARMSTFMVDLWVNYDCNLYCGDLFEEVVKFLSWNSFPDSTGYSASNSHILCLDALLLYVNYMADRLQTEKIGEDFLTSELSWDPSSATDYKSESSKYPSPVDLLEKKKKKRILIEGAAKFNENPKVGLEFLEANKIIYNDPSMDKSTSLASFLKVTPRLNKNLLGDFLSKPSNIDILKAFVKLFNFNGKRIDEAMREMLESFRLPGESQQISRIMENFAEIYFASGPPEIATQDATFVLSYSVIMLNTDLHNPQVRRRMTIQDYMNNLRNVNNGENFAPEYLQAIYDAIRQKEIVMPEEHEGQLGFNYAWKELLRRAETSGPLVICNVSLYDKDMFTVVWKPLIAAIAYAFNSAPDDTILQKAITGFHQCALISAHYNLLNVFDYIIMSLGKMTGLLDSRYSIETANIPVKVQDIELPVSNLAIQFGRNYKGQLAAVVLFAVANEHGSVLRDGWKYLLEIIKNLFLNSLLPSSMLQVEDFLAGTTTIPLKPKSASLPKQERANDNSLLSTLSSYLLSPYSSNYESTRSDPTEEEIESTLCTVDCVAVCRLEELFADIRVLEQESLENLMNSLKFIADGNLTGDAKTTPRSSSPVSITQPNASQPSSHSSAMIPYDPAAIFFLELMINVTLQNRDRIQTLWPILFEHISQILKESQNHSILLVERTVVALLRLCIRLTHKDEMASDVLKSLELLKALPLEVINSVGEQMMAGILNLIKADASYIRGKALSETIFALLSSTSNHPQACKYSFDAVASLVIEYKNISTHNFSECVELLTDFASAATLVAQRDNYQDNIKNPRIRITKTQSAVIERARKAVELLYHLYKEIPKLLNETETSSREAWSTYWLPILTGLSQQSYNPCREVRQYAITYLQRALLDPELVSHGVSEWVVIFDVVLFPLLDQLLKPEIFEADPVGMEETRMRASALLCRIFLHYLNKLIEWGGLLSLWCQILDVMERYMDTGENDSLAEAISESLKNMLLVMSTSGVLNLPAPPTSPLPEISDEVKGIGRTPIDLWDITWTKIGKFLPKLKEELFPTVSSSMTSAEAIPNESASGSQAQSGFEIIDRDASENSNNALTLPLQPVNIVAKFENSTAGQLHDGGSSTSTSVSDDVIIV